MIKQHKNKTGIDQILKLKHISTGYRYSGTTFASLDRVHTESFTPNVNKANKLRTQKYW